MCVMAIIICTNSIYMNFYVYKLIIVFSILNRLLIFFNSK